MTGRGIDQVLPNPGQPIIHEFYMKSARGYVDIAEKANGEIKKPVAFSYIWGAALQKLKLEKPDLRIINLETSITSSEDFWKWKSIHYRMHPKNILVLNEANIDFCSLANNHILDWGYSGFFETLEVLKKAKLKAAGAGKTLKEAERPVVFNIKGKGRVIVFSFGHKTSGIPLNWGALKNRPGVNLLKDLSNKVIGNIKRQIKEIKQKRDIVIASIHWGSNWGYNVPSDHREFAHKLIDEAGVDIIHGHSSHHVRPIEVYKNKPIFYGCGDFINDYEGITGFEEFRDDLALMYFVSMDPSTINLLSIKMIPLQIKKFSLYQVSKEDLLWLEESLNVINKNFKTKVKINKEGSLILGW
jgi:poly-gamma-glutamate synthesis protein (capsule biosynthesis protein)